MASPARVSEPTPSADSDLPPAASGTREPASEAGRPRGRDVALAALFVVVVVLRARYSYEIVSTLADPARRVRPPLAAGGLEPTVFTAGPEAAQAGLKRGDRIREVDGRPLAGLHPLAATLRAARPGQTLAITASRPSTDGEERVVLSIPLVARYRVDLAFAQTAVLVILGLFTPALCLVLGFGVAALRPRDPRAWILLFVMLSFADMASPRHVDLMGWGWVRVPALAWREMLAGTWGVWMLLFGIAFPERLALDRRHPWLKWIVLVPILGNALAGAVATVGESEGLRATRPAFTLLELLGRVPFFAGVFAVSAFFACLGYKRGTASSPDTRRRLALLQWGGTVSLTPIFLLVVSALVRGHDVDSHSPWLLVPGLLALAGFPLTLAYVIVVHQALDVRVVVRQGLQYALASRGVLVLQFIVILVTVLAVGNLAGTANRPKRVQYMAAGILIVLLTRRAAERLRKIVDRRFFREAYDAEQILSALSEDVRTIVDTDQLLSTVGQRIASSLHVPRFAALVRQDGAYATAYTLGEGSAVRLADASAVVARLRASRQPLRVDLDDRGNWIHGQTTADDRRALAALDTRLLLPLAVKDDLLGILSLGPKQSEEPYSPSDVRLLQSVAAQTAVALENSRLTAAIAEETALRARMSREIEIAREVQQGLFPQHYPPVPGIEYVGYCRPAQGVGGDYYDFVRVGDSLGIAVGDISGKGIPAALLMASLQASLRAQAISAPPDLATLMANLNELIYENSPPNRYATFFYGQYHPATRRLDYVNAGHNAPMLFRSAGQDVAVLRVDGGGPVIGLLPAAAYTQCSMVLHPGDLFVGYTDGFSEALSVADEEWGEERMIAAVKACRDRPPQQIVETVLAEADRFCAGAKQHDDMTVIVLRVSGG